MNRILSGIQPTANMHLGNYLGAVRNWAGLQDSFEALYCVVDLHALTQSPADLRTESRDMAAALMASGIDPNRSILFVQSSVPAHCELAWLMSCVTPLGWLNRMTQFKEKSGKNRELAVLGLYSYPVLMAADILVYRATHVPVGEDQRQHLELTREIAGAFNHRFNCTFFPQPEPQIFGTATRVMSLRDGTKKMAKSDGSDYSRINMTDDADTIALKFRKAKTDPLPLPATAEGLEGRPEADNLVNIFAALTHKTVDAVLTDFAEATFSTFKTALTDVAVDTLAPIAAEMRRLLADPGYVEGVLAEGGEKARAIADANLRDVREIMGILTPQAGPSAA